MIDLEQPSARVLQSPLDERHAELCAARPMVASDICLRRNRQFVFAAVQTKNPVDLHSRVSLRLDLSANAVGPENDFCEFSTLQHILVHFLVAAIVPAFSTAGVHNDFSARFPRSRIDLQTSA